MACVNGSPTLRFGVGGMLGPPGRDIGVDAAIGQRLKVRLAEIAAVRRGSLGLRPKFFRDAIDERHELGMVAHALGDALRHDDLMRAIDPGLGVVAEPARQLARLLGIGPGATVGDIGAGSGYHTVRLSPVVGPSGRIIAQDLKPEYLADLANRVRELRLGNVTLALGEPHDPRMPPASLDVALLVHVYHEIAQPYAFLYNLAPALKPGARLGIVDVDAKTWDHGTPPDLLQCELAAVGYRQTAFYKLTGSLAYLAVFAAPAVADRKPPAAIIPCRTQQR